MASSTTDWSAFGGREGRGAVIWKRQSSETIEARTEIECARRSGAESLPTLPLRGEGDCDRRPDLLREDRRGAFVESAAEDPSSESLRVEIEYIYHR